MYLPRFAGDLTTFVLLTATLAMQSGVPAAEPPAPPRLADIERALAAARTARLSETPPRPLTVVLLSDRKDHGENEHDTWTFVDPYFRILVLRGMAWAAGEDPHRFDELVLHCAAVTQE